MNKRKESLFDHLGRFISLDKVDIENINLYSNIKTYDKGDYLVRQGSICMNENYIIEGCTYSYILDDEGKKHVMRCAVDDWWATDLGSFINQQAAILNIQCLKKTTVVEFSYENLNRLYGLVPSLEKFFRIVTQKAFVAAQNRILHKLSLPAKERYLLFIKQYPNIEQHLPQYLIASYLGITKQFLSKIRYDAKKSDLLI